MKYRPQTILCSLLTCTSIAFAQESPSRSLTWTLSTEKLELIETILTQANEQEITTIDTYGLRRRWAINDLFFALPTTTSPSRTNPFANEPGETQHTRYITLTDGQVLKGVLLEPRHDDALTCWVYTGTTMRGSATIALEKVRSISDRPRGIWEPVDAQSDSITTISDDVFVGFVESVGPKVTIATSRDLVKIDLDQIREIRLANIPERIDGIYLSTAEGLRLRISTFDFDFQHALSATIDPQALGFDADAPSMWVMPPEAPAGIEIIRSDRQILSLTNIDPQLIEPTGGRDWTPAPTVLSSAIHPILSAIDLHAPVRVIYPLPEDAVRFACTLLPSINTWTDCIASIYAIAHDGQRTELLNTRLNADHTTQSLNVAIEPNTAYIEIRIDPGASGPIQDRVLIEHPRVLLETN